MKEPSSEVLAAAKRGDAAAREAVLQWSSELLHGYVRRRMGRLLRSLESSADLAQSVCAEVLVDLPRFEEGPDDGFRRWLTTCAERKILKRCRFHRQEKRDARRKEVLPESLDRATPSEGDSPSHQAVLLEELGQLEAALDQLPDDYREVIVLTRLVGLSHEQAAERMDRSVNATWSLLSRALARLALLMEEKE